METVSALMSGVGLIVLSIALHVQNKQIQRLQNEVKHIRKTEKERRRGINYVK